MHANLIDDLFYWFQTVRDRIPGCSIFLEQYFEREGMLRITTVTKDSLRASFELNSFEHHMLSSDSLREQELSYILGILEDRIYHARRKNKKSLYYHLGWVGDLFFGPGSKILESIIGYTTTNPKRFGMEEISSIWIKADSEEQAKSIVRHYCVNFRNWLFCKEYDKLPSIDNNVLPKTQWIYERYQKEKEK